MRSNVSSAWSPLQVQVFRGLWIAVLVSNIGTWMQTVGAQWLLIDEPRGASLVAFVQTASTLPMLLLALPVGVLAEQMNRRHLLIGVQAFQVIVAGTLTAVVATDRITPMLLLAFTFLLGAGAAAQGPIYMALIPELVPRRELAQAAVLGAVGLNIARVIGPPIAGVLIAQVGVAAVFALNTLSFFVFIVVLLRWRDYRPTPVPRTAFFTSLVAGGRYVIQSPVMRRLLLRYAAFLIPGNALWALLAVVAAGPLDMGSTGYGLLLGSLAGGALLGASFLPRLRALLAFNTMVAISGAVIAVCLAVMALVPHLGIVVPLLVITGAAWIAVLSSFSAAAQLHLPPEVRARGLSIYQLVLYGSLTLGATLWGFVVPIGLTPTLVIAAGMLLLGVVASRFWPLFNTEAHRPDDASVSQPVDAPEEATPSA